MSKNIILRSVGFVILLLGIGLNVVMFFSEAWPTYMYFILCGVGLFFILISSFVKNLKKRW